METIREQTMNKDLGKESKIGIMQKILLLKILVILLNISWITLWQGEEYIRKMLNLICAKKEMS